MSLLWDVYGLVRWTHTQAVSSEAYDVRGESSGRKDSYTHTCRVDSHRNRDVDRNPHMLIYVLPVLKFMDHDG